MTAKPQSGAAGSAAPEEENTRGSAEVKINYPLKEIGRPAGLAGKGRKDEHTGNEA